MRTKKAKKYKALPNYPLKKLFKTLGEYAEQYHGYVYNEEEQGYGYYSNPNAFYDWYVIGGRWPRVFLLKESCTEYSLGESYRDEESDGAPEGYIWVSVARKKDVEWDLMMKLAKEHAKHTYEVMRQAFIDQKLPEGYYGRIKELSLSMMAKISRCTMQVIGISPRKKRTNLPNGNASKRNTSKRIHSPKPSGNAEIIFRNALALGFTEPIL